MNTTFTFLLFKLSGILFYIFIESFILRAKYAMVDMMKTLLTSTSDPVLIGSHWPGPSMHLPVLLSYSSSVSFLFLITAIFKYQPFC